MILQALFTASVLFIGILVFMEAGRWWGNRRIARVGESAKTGIGAIEGAVFALMGLLIAFSFSGAVSRFDDRRKLVIEEANHIGTAWLRLDLLHPADQPALKELFRQYLDARLAYTENVGDLELTRSRHQAVLRLQDEIWAKAMAALSRTSPDTRPAILLVPALNQMFDIASTRVGATYIHPPLVIFAMLIVLTLTSALQAGYGMAGTSSRHVFHMVVFAAIISITVYLILDMEFPRRGFVQVRDIDRILLDLRAGMDGK